MAQRGRPRKYSTDEERLEARRIKQLEHHNSKIGKEETHYGKRHTINNKDGITIKIETLNRICITVVDIEYCVTFRWIEDRNLFKLLRQTVQETINRWLETQVEWDPKNRIFVWENPEYKEKGEYRPKHQCASFQLYLKKITPPVPWKTTLDMVLPLTDMLTDIIKNTCQEVGIVIEYRKQSNADWWEKQQLADDAASSPSKEDTTVS